MIICRPSPLLLLVNSARIVLLVCRCNHVKICDRELYGMRAHGHCMVTLRVQAIHASHLELEALGSVCCLS